MPGKDHYQPECFCYLLLLKTNKLKKHSRPGRQAAPLRLSRWDCGLRRAPANGQFGLVRRQAGYLRPLAG